LIANRPKSNQRDALRARIILEASGGLSNTEIARRERVSLPTVGKWRSRYARQKIEALADAPRSGAPRSIDDKKVEEVLTKTLETTPRARTHWSSRLMAKEAGISEHSVLRIWRAFGLKPHRVDSFKLSADPMFVEKVRDIVGLYLNPPDKAIVLCVDEKSQTQALERSQPILPLRPGLPERQTHDYVRHGTLSLFAAYDAATGRVLGRCHQRHRHQEFLAFLERIDAAFPDDGKSQLHLIIDNYSTHKTPKSIAGCYVIHAFIFTSLPLAVPGSTWSSASSLVSLQRPFAGEASLRCDNSKPPLMPTSQNTIKNPNLLLGLPLQIPSLGNSKTPFLKLTSLSGH
jgi:Transposase and inactivated derivatives